MKTPIYDFVKKYGESGFCRFHMPGHKGKPHLGVEKYDITEIEGADNLYSPSGIILESEENASALFGTAHSFYSAEGSTLAIKAMLAVALSGKSRRPRVLAARNAHKAFIYAAALLDFDVEWLFPESFSHLCSCLVTPSEIAAALDTVKPDALYLTTPDYLGNILDIEAISRECKKREVPLLVDNAHGAYLAFLKPSMHPVALGADMCCDSAHKTLPVLTGGAYLHISEKASAEYLSSARRMMSLFASTSPSYVILESLDLCNKYLSSGYIERLSDTVLKVEKVKSELSLCGYTVEVSEPLKITVNAAEYGYSGTELAEALRKNKIEVEYADSEYVVFMVTPENSDSDLERLVSAMKGIPKLNKIIIKESFIPDKIRVTKMSIREAMFSDTERIAVENSVGRICASPTVSCPPAVPIAVSGELISENDVKHFIRHGIYFVDVVKE